MCRTPNRNRNVKTTTAGPLAGRPRWATARGPKTLGVTMIVKDEADNLPHVFETIRDIADEVVVVDTGSRDGTLALCKQWGVTLLQDRWRNDFARARNRSLQAATAKYLLWLDGDDRLPEATRRELVRLRDEVLPNTRGQAYQFQIRNLDEQGRVSETFIQTRLFPRVPDLRWAGAVHEQINPSLQAAGVEIVNSPIVLEHMGYADPEMLRGKQARNEALLREALRDEPNHPLHLLHMAHAHAQQGRGAEAEAAISDAILQSTQAGTDPHFLAELHATRASYRSGIGNALGAVYDLEEAERLWPGWGLPLSLLAGIRMGGGDWDAAWAAIERARTSEFTPGYIAAGIDRARSNVEWYAGHILLRRGQPEQAIERLRAALLIDEANLDARLELGDALLRRREFEEARAVLEPAGEDPNAVDHFVEVSAAIGLARAMTGDNAGAGACLAPLLELFAAELRGADEVGALELAEAALRSGHPEAAKNLMALFQETLAPAA